MLHVRAGGCNGEALGCDDGNPLADGEQSDLTLAVEAEATYFVFVDGFSQNNAGPFTLTISQGACQ